MTLSPKQQEVIRLLREGWVLKRGNVKATKSITKLEKDGARIVVDGKTFVSLRNRYLICMGESEGMYMNYILTQQGEKLEL